MFKVFTMAAVLLLVFACSPGAVTPVTPPGDGELVLTPEGVPIKVAVGETFEIILEANPTTGYAWEIDSIGDLQLVKPVADSQYYKDDAPRGIVGVGGKEVWTFSAENGGSTVISFRYVPEEAGRDRERTIEFLIEIQE